MWQQLIKDFQPFMDRVAAFANELSIDTGDLSIDHAAIRLKNPGDVVHLEKELENVGQKLSAAIVNGRRICIFKLHTPLTYHNQEVSCVELPYPAQEHIYTQDGWEHIEYVLPSATPATLEQAFSSRFPILDIAKRKNYNFRITTPDVKGEQLANTTIALEKYVGLAIKFHCYPIELVVKS